MWAANKSVTQAGVDSESYAIYGVVSVEIVKSNLAILSNKLGIVEPSEEAPDYYSQCVYIRTFTHYYSGLHLSPIFGVNFLKELELMSLYAE